MPTRARPTRIGRSGAAATVGAAALRSDAQRNRDRLLAAATALFGSRGLDVPMAEIAAHAGVANGTLYNRFPTRDALVDAVFTDRLRTLADLADRAAADPDPWDGFVGYLVAACELQAANRGFNEVVVRRMGWSAEARRHQQRARRSLTEVMRAAQRTGRLRDDVVIEDLAFVMRGVSSTIDATIDATTARGREPWRRHLALLIDGLRADGATPLPVPPSRRRGTH